MADRIHITQASGAPSSAPPAVAAHYINTATGDQYVAAATGSWTDWRLIAQVSDGVSEIAGTTELTLSQATRLILLYAADYDEALDEVSRSVTMLNIGADMMTGSHSFEVRIECEPSVVSEVFIRGTVPETPIYLDAQRVSDLNVSGPGGSWQIEILGVRSFECRIDVVGGRVSITQLSAELEPTE